MSVQQTEKFVFGTGRLYYTPSGSTTRGKYAGLNDAEFDYKVDQKEAYGEGGFPIFVGDGHRAIDIQVKHYIYNLATMANDMGLAAPGAGQWGYTVDEAVVVPTTPFKYTLVNGATLVVGTVDLVMNVLTGSIIGPVTYAFVTAGMEVAGVSASITAVGVITFAAADVGLSGKVTYKFTSAAGKQISIVNSFQNSIPYYQMELVKRDISPLDNSVGYLIATFNSVRFGGFKMPIKEGELSNLDRTFKAFADPTGQVGYLNFVNLAT